MNWRTISFLAVLLAAGLFVLPAFGRPPEITPGLEPVTTPIYHQQYYRLEREQFGYNPLFVSNNVQFDSNNVPYIRQDSAVQTLDSSGNWLRLDFSATLQAALPTWDGTYVVGPETMDERIVFDDDDDAYTLLRPNPGLGLVLMYSRDLCRTWTVYPLPSSFSGGLARISFRDGNNDLSNPPVILGRPNNVLWLCIMSKNPNGTLSMIYRSFPWNDATEGGLNPEKGASNLVVTIGDKTHVVFNADEEEPGYVGTPHYAITYNHTTDSMGSVVYLGSTGKGLDSHNWPGISVDSLGYLHVVLGAHGYADGSQGYSSEYIKSLSPNSTTSGWTAPHEFGITPGITYLSFLCDPNDNLHMAFRNHNYGSTPMRLGYVRKESGQSWESRNNLVYAFESTIEYTNFKQKINLDRRGRLFLNYWTFKNMGAAVQQNAYDAKWPCDGGTPAVHSPAMLMSDDAGDTWRLAVTDDFVNGIIP